VHLTMAPNNRDDEASGRAAKKRNALQLQEVLAEVWIAIVIALFVLLRVLDSSLFKHLYSRWKAF